MNTSDDNATSNRQKDLDAEGYILAVYTVFINLSSLVGDTLILYASFQKDAIKLHKLIVIVMRYIAVSDLSSIISVYIPGAISWSANGWSPGDALCRISTYIGPVAFSSGCILVAVLTSSKFLILKFPLRAATWTKKMAHLACCLPLIPSLIFVIVSRALDGDVAFDSIVSACKLIQKADFWTILLPVVCVVVIFIPNLVVVSTTVLILHNACRSAQRVNTSVRWQGTMAVVLTAVVYLISTLPSYAYFLAKDSIKYDPTGWFHYYFFRFSYAILGINVISNFYIYTLTIRSFRGFLKSKILSIFSSVQTIFRNTSSTGKFPKVFVFKEFKEEEEQST